ncbi:MAG: MXAN_5187 C-terminal domain-containing protein [Sandaracinaceae bacterium]
MRTKIIVGNLVAVVFVGLSAWALTWFQLRSAYQEEVDRRVVNDASLLARFHGLGARELAEQVQAQAATRSGVFIAPTEELARRRAHRQANRVAQHFSGTQRNQLTTEVVYLTDHQGRVIARDRDPNRDFGLDLRSQLAALPSVLEDGVATTDLWLSSRAGQPKLLLVGIAPIRSPSAEVVGALVVGKELSRAWAERLVEPFGNLELAILGPDGIYSSTLPQPLSDELGSALYDGEAREHTLAVIGAGDDAVVGPWPVELGGDQYVGVSVPVPMSQTSDAAFAILGDRSAGAARASMVHVILLITLLGAIVVVIYGYLVVNGMLAPIERMEEGVLAVINGRTDLRLDIESAELGGLAYGINQLLNVFTGTPESDEEGRISGPPGAPWQDPETEAELAAPAVPDPAAGAMREDGEAVDPDVAAALAAEPEGAYYVRIYHAYVEAKEAIGEDVSAITQDRFVQRLQANERALIQKHGCRMVRFQVHVRGTQVNLRPVLIR